MAAQTNKTKDDAFSTVPESLNQLLARILNQLNVTAWFPAATLVFIALIYGELRISNANFLKALGNVGSMGRGPLGLSIGAVILGSFLTQALEVRAIRVLEGYWGSGWLATELADFGCALHSKKRDKMERKRHQLETAAHRFAEEQMHKEEELRKGNRRLTSYIRTWLSELLHVQDPGPADWYTLAPPRDIRRLLECSRRLSEEYPSEDYQLRPTRLGNVLRAYELRAFDPYREHMEGLVEGVFHLLPAHLQADFDAAKSQLNINCTMVFVFILSAVAAIPTIALTPSAIRQFPAGMPWTVAATALVISALLAAGTYGAAIASAKTYGAILETIVMLTASASKDT